MLNHSEMSWLRGAICASDEEIKLTALPFYPGGLLARFNQAGRMEEYFIVGEGPITDREVFHINGDSEIVHDANSSYGVSITMHTVLDYLRFFCASIGNENDRFRIVEQRTFRCKDSDCLICVGSLQIVGPSALGFICQGWTAHCGKIFECRFEVNVDGYVNMVDDSGGVSVAQVN
jgi:hypothetical protein